MRDELRDGVEAVVKSTLTRGVYASPFAGLTDEVPRRNIKITLINQFDFIKRVSYRANVLPERKRFRIRRILFSIGTLRHVLIEPCGSF